MKRFLSFATLMLIAFHVMAIELTDTYTFTSKTWTANPANWTSGKAGESFYADGVEVTEDITGANATSPVSYDNITRIVITYNTYESVGAGTLEVKIGSNAAKINDWQFDPESDDGESAYYTSEFDYSSSPESGYVKLTVNTTENGIYVVSVAITYDYVATTPEIIAEKIELGTSLIGLGDAGYAKDTTLAVTGTNLSAPISVGFIGTHLSATESELPASGGTLHLHAASAAALVLADTVVLTSGETELKVPVVGKIKQNIALPGAAAAMAQSLMCADVTVDGIDGIRVGTLSNAGAMTITVPANAGKLRFYATGWKDKSVTISLSAPAGVTLSSTSMTLVSDAGANGNSPYELDALTPSAFAQEILLTGVTEETVITLSSASTEKRFLVWDAKYDYGYVVNYLDKAGATLASDAVMFNLPEAPVVSGFTFLYWKVLEGNISTGINIQAVYQSNTPTDAPAVVVNPANPAQKLIREGNVYILHDGKQYNLRGARL